MSSFTQTMKRSWTEVSSDRRVVAAVSDLVAALAALALRAITREPAEEDKP